MLVCRSQEWCGGYILQMYRTSTRWTGDPLGTQSKDRMPSDYNRESCSTAELDRIQDFIAGMESSA